MSRHDHPHVPSLPQTGLSSAAGSPLNATQQSRRELLRQTGAGLASLAIAPYFSAKQVVKVTDAVGLTDPLTGSALYQDVKKYFDFGEHHTGMASDIATADWVERHLADQGYQTERQRFTVAQTFVNKVELWTGGRGLAKVDAYPLWPATFPARSIARQVASYSPTRPSTVAGKIALISFPFSVTGLITTEMIRQVEAVAAAGAVALVAISEGPTNHVTVMNPIDGRTAWPIPVVLVGKKDESQLIAAAKSSSRSTLILEGRANPATAVSNVLGRQIQAENAPWIIVSTPLSGWFRCGGERGPGVAMLRGLSRWLASRRRAALGMGTPLNSLFIGTTGHELSALGIDVVLKNAVPRPERVKLWFHLGAWVTSYAWSNAVGTATPVRLTTENSRYLIAPTGTDASLKELLKLPGLLRVRTPFGEAQQIYEAGYRNVVAITGRNVPHHTRLDVATNTGPALLEPVARAISRYIIERETAVDTPA